MTTHGACPRCGHRYDARGVAESRLQPIDVARALILYLYNVDRDAIVAEVFGIEHGPLRWTGSQRERFTRLVGEYAPLVDRSYGAFFGALDATNQRRLVDAAIERYAEEARHRRQVEERLDG